ncbi:multidrug ABC transporter ATP-binding protein [Massilia sp. Root351]|jgi:ABC-type multidrug transport system ATPase subunit|uniref:ABC transporter ATP-binding protein n=1 Tax=Massilia sp. Root351 TaxID=1736522 RepID=UPI00070DA684|nr:ABC transporter ATP-binding protein [Massilia sp. Root351]KQV88585.1 multidrug ABC transporter ATP-binding protein [Massilia sp. Root351]|eukprot:gene32903-40618_t
MELRIRNLSKTYANGVVALDNISLTIPAGMFGLLGPNGAGKSTLMRTLATLQECDSGSVFLGELDVLDEKDEIRRLLGYLPQDFGVYPKVSAYEMLDHFAVLKGLSNRARRREVVDGLLQQTNLFEVRHQKLGTYSGGMRQRFGIAQALLGDPKLIIVDEPTAGLDPQERVRFHNLLSDIGEDRTVILSTHIVSDVADLCASMAIINKGHLLLTGQTQQLIDDISCKIWARFVDKKDLQQFQTRHAVISTRLLSGRTLIHVYSDDDPGDGFEEAIGDLEDLYFATIAGRHSAADSCD